MVAVISSMFGLIEFTILEIVRFLDFRALAETAYSRPLLGKADLGIFPRNDVTYRLTPERHLLVPKHVVWVIKRENQSSGIRPVRVIEKTGQDSQKVW